jgi:hypothetical protein
MHAYGEHKTGREGNRGGYEQRVSEKERGEHMDTGESEECAGIWWKSEEYFDERESDTKRVKRSSWRETEDDPEEREAFPVLEEE